MEATVTTVTSVEQLDNIQTILENIETVLLYLYASSIINIAILLVLIFFVGRSSK